jgi:hypothetical protein
MNDRHAKRLIPRLEAMEDRVALSATALAIHDVPAAHVRHSPRNPIVVNLDPQTTGIQITDAAIDTRIGVIRIKGVVTYPPLNPPPYYPPYYPPYCPLTPTVSLSLSVTQAVNRRSSVSGYLTSHQMNYVSTGFSAPFTLYVAAGSGYFVPGKATVALSTYLPYYSPSQDSPSASAVVRLREVRF